MDNREYKIITSNVPMFKNMGKLKALLEEEARAGWDLEEKLDDNRIRLSRDKSARDNDTSLDFDPYRTTVGLNNVIYFGLAAIITILIIVLILMAASASY